MVRPGTGRERKRNEDLRVCSGRNFAMVTAAGSSALREPAPIAPDLPRGPISAFVAGGAGAGVGTSRCALGLRLRPFE